MRDKQKKSSTYMYINRMGLISRFLYLSNGSTLEKFSCFVGGGGGRRRRRAVRNIPQPSFCSLVFVIEVQKSANYCSYLYVSVCVCVVVCMQHQYYHHKAPPHHTR